MDENKLKVIFIGGSSRSGSTLLDRILGQIDGFFSLGEMYHIWERSFIENQLCGCGKPFKECSFWQEVVKEAFGGFDKVDPRYVLRLRRSVERMRYIPLLSYRMLRPKGYQYRLSEYIEIWSRLYKAIHKITGANVLVDSSKLPTHGFLLNALPNVDLYVLHLVRDSRAVAHSWQRKKRRPEIYWKEAYMPRFGILRSTREWVLSNSLIRILRKMVPHYTIIRYEDFVAHPQLVLTQVFKGWGLKVPHLETLFDGRAINLGVNHAVSGNPMRFEQGRIEIKLDEEWKKKMPSHKRIAVTVLTWPFLLKYAYLVRRDGGGAKCAFH